MNPLKELKEHGQAVWLDYMRRSLLSGGELKRMIDEDGITGATINPTIFEKAIAGSQDYDKTMSDLLKVDPHMDTRKLYESLIIEDVQTTADILRPIYDETSGGDGYVSLELSPDLATDTEGSIKEARYFWNLVDRPNLLIKVPATSEGIPVIEELISEGINVNVTLMFSLSDYEAVANAYLDGVSKSDDPSRVTSVASFFVSRVETIVDKALEENGSSDALNLKGKIAVANSKVVYQRFKEIFTSNRWKELEEKGARVQRVLWASTGTKNPEYSDVVYVEELILKDTINTMPPATMNAFLDHGNVKDSLESGVEEADANIKKLESLGIDLDNLTEKLQVEGVNAFEQSYDKLIETLEEKRKAILQGQKERMELCLGKYQRPVDDRLKVWKEMRFNRRLWDKDPSLWFDEPVPEITNRLGWLNLPEMMHEHLDELASFAEGVKDDGISHVVLLGMGGSSLAPGVFKSTFGSRARYPELMVLDSTHPDAIIEIQKRVDLRRTLFIVASKSGTTLEPTSLFKFFWEQVKGLIEDPGSRFIAITDPGTPLVKVAEEKRFRRLFLAPTDLGGRFSALTVFGLVPAALIGVNLHRLLDRAWVAAEGCAFCVEEDKVSGLILGAALGELALRGVDKVTFITTPSIRSFPNWLEQLIAESTGKEGKGIIPVASEVLQDKKSHKEDRFFVYLFVEGEEDEDVKGTVKALEDAGHPIARIGLADRYDIGMEIFRWELAVASAGSVMGIHPFNQPDVELAKELAREAMKGDNVAAVDDLETISIEENDRLTSEIEGLLNQAGDRDYIAIQAYIQPSEKADELLSSIRMKLFESLGLATTSGYGPRFLHSTGQLHKGGPDTGLFIQLVDEPSEGLSVPDSGYTFRDIIAAQSFGDFHALVKIGRKVLRVNLKEDAIDGLSIILDLL